MTRKPLCLPHVLLFLLAVAGASAREPREGGVYQGGDHTGCAQTVNASAPQAHTVQSRGLARNYTVTLPANYTNQQQYPVLVGYHGYPGRGLYLEVDSGLDAAAADKIIVYPDGAGGAWAGANYSATTAAQDLQFTWDLLADVRARYCVDSARVYATGISNGAGFVAAVLACNATVGGEFAAFAPVAGAYYADAYYADARRPRDGNRSHCVPARPLTPILEFHGGADSSVLYDGGQGEGGYEPPIADWLSWWAERNDCQDPPQQIDSFDNTVHHLVWTCRDVKGVLQHYKIDTMKHAWPSTKPNFSQKAAGDVPTHIDASDIMQDFFRNFTRPAAPDDVAPTATPGLGTPSTGSARSLDSCLVAVIGVTAVAIGVCCFW